jgi:hypothetical protein
MKRKTSAGIVFAIHATAMLVIVVAPVLVAPSGCAKFNERLAWAHHALHWTALAGEAVDEGVAAYQRSETQRCLKTHGSKTEAYAECIGKSLKVTRKWTGCDKAGKSLCKGGVALALQDAQRSARKALETAYKAGKGDVYGAVKGAVCALAPMVKIAKDAGVDFKQYEEEISSLLGLAEGLCK